MEGEEDPDLINAGEQTITELPSTSYFSSVGFLRDDPRRPYRPVDPGRHAGCREWRSRQLDDPRQDGEGHERRHGPLGRRQARGGRDGARGPGKDGTEEPKLLKTCTLPLTGAGVVDLVVTDLGVFAIGKKGGTGMTLVELADGVTAEVIQAKTEAEFEVSLNGKHSDAA